MRREKDRKSSKETMNRRDFNKLLSAAVAGMVGAGALASCSSNGKHDDAGGGAKHACKGMNDCKGKGGCASGNNGCKGKNDCKGKGGCATAAAHSCKGQNDCKGQGGCGSGNNGCKGKNDCKGKGGCAVPIKH
jgi:hypothetical protein